MTNEPIDLSESLQDPGTELVSRAARRFRLRSTLRTIVISVLVVIVGSGLLYLTTIFDPFTERGSWSIIAKDLTLLEADADHQPGSGIVYEYKPGAKLMYAFILRNNSGLPVEVIGFPTSRDFLTRLQVRTAGTAWVNDDATSEEPQPFKPFRLKPDEERWIIFDLAMPACSWFEDDIDRHIPMSSISGSSTDFTTFIGALGSTPVRYRVFGLPREGIPPLADTRLGVAIPNTPGTTPTPKPHPTVC